MKKTDNTELWTSEIDRFRSYRSFVAVGTHSTNAHYSRSKLWHFSRETFLLAHFVVTTKLTWVLISEFDLSTHPTCLTPFSKLVYSPMPAQPFSCGVDSLADKTLFDFDRNENNSLYSFSILWLGDVDFNFENVQPLNATINTYIHFFPRLYEQRNKNQGTNEFSSIWFSIGLRVQFQTPHRAIKWHAAIRFGHRCVFCNWALQMNERQ